MRGRRTPSKRVVACMLVQAGRKDVSKKAVMYRILGTGPLTATHRSREVPRASVCPGKATRPHKLAPTLYGPGHVVAQEHDTVIIALIMDPTPTVIKNEAHVRRLLTTDQDRSEERLVALAAHDLDQVAIRKIIDHRPKDWTSTSSHADRRMEAQCVS